MPALARFPPVPTAPLDASGRPRLGAYSGALDRVDLRPLTGDGLRGRWRRLTALKRWHHAFVASREVLLTLAVVDAGYAASGFLFAVDLAAGATLLDRAFLALPPAAHVNDRPGAGARATLDTPGASLRIERRSDRYQLLADLGRAGSLEAALDTAGAPAPFTLVANVPGVPEGGVNVTQKSGALPATGTLRCGARTFALDGGWGGLDYTQGLLARSTRWRWAYATGLAGGAPVAINLVEGFNAGAVSEDVLLTVGGPAPLPACRFEHDRERPLAPWHVASADGAVDLRFTPVAAHQEDRDLRLVRTRFVQVAGTFDGRIASPGGPLAIVALPGVCEDQEVTW